MDGREILNVVVTEKGVKCMINGTLIEATDATAQVVKSVYNAIEQGGRGAGQMYKFLLLMSLNNMKSGVWDPVPDEDVKKKEGCVINTALLDEIASDLEEEIKRRKSDETDRNPED